MSRSELTPKEIEELIGDAESAFPDSYVVSGIADWFADHGWITEAQESALNRISDSTPPWEREDD